MLKIRILIDQLIRKIYQRYPHNRSFIKLLHLIDNSNTKYVKNFINSKESISKNDSHNIWLLVQHSGDLALMKNLLKRMETNKDIFGTKDYAYLKDRILIKENKKQIYGTQLKRVGQYLEFNEIENIKNINKRRKEVGIENLEEYIRKVEKESGLKVKINE